MTSFFIIAGGYSITETLYRVYLLDFGQFLLLIVMNNATVNVSVQFLCEHVIPAVLGTQVTVQSPGLCRVTLCLTGRCCQGAFQRHRTALHSQQSCARVPFPHVPAHMGYWLFHYNHRNGQEWYCGILIGICLITDNARRLSCAVGTCVSSLERRLCRAVARFLISICNFIIEL